VHGRPVWELLDISMRMLDILPVFLCSFNGAEHGPSLPSSTVVRFFARREEKQILCCARSKVAPPCDSKERSDEE